MKASKLNIPKGYLWALLAALGLNMSWQVGQLQKTGSSQLASKADLKGCKEVNQQDFGQKGKFRCELAVTYKDKAGKDKTETVVVNAERFDKDSVTQAAAPGLYDMTGTKIVIPVAKVDPSGEKPNVQEETLVLKDLKFSFEKSDCACDGLSSTITIGNKTTFKDILDSLEKKAGEYSDVLAAREKTKKEEEEQAAKDKKAKELADKEEAMCKKKDGKAMKGEDRWECITTNIATEDDPAVLKALSTSARNILRNRYAVDPEGAALESSLLREALLDNSSTLTMDDKATARSTFGLLGTLEVMERGYTTKKQLAGIAVAEQNALLNLRRVPEGSLAEISALSQLETLEMRRAMIESQFDQALMNTTMSSSLVGDAGYESVLDEMTHWRDQIAQVSYSAAGLLDYDVRGRGGLGLRGRGGLGLRGRAGIDTFALDRSRVRGGLFDSSRLGLSSYDRLGLGNDRFSGLGRNRLGLRDSFSSLSYPSLRDSTRTGLLGRSNLGLNGLGRSNLGLNGLGRSQVGNF